MNDETLSLIEKSQQGDRLASEKLVEQNSGLIWAVTRRYFGRGAEPDDLFQLGCIGFLKAVAGFDRQYGTQFSTYAVPKIAGEIRRFLRDDGSVKVSRTLKERAAAIYGAQQKFVAEHGFEPTLSELSAILELTPEQIAAAQTAASPPQSMQQDMTEDGFSLENILCDDSMEDKLINSLSLRDAIASLSERERLVISLRYVHSLTQQRTADVLGVSQVQISRIEKKALQELRKRVLTE